jgi:AraC family transcriptional regulator
MNETLNDFIARRRLEVAINKLVTQNDLSITTIAFESGFSSSANFAKAVKQYFGHSPSKIRKGKSITDSKMWQKLKWDCSVICYQTVVMSPIVFQ